MIGIKLIIKLYMRVALKVSALSITALGLGEYVKYNVETTNAYKKLLKSIHEDLKITLKKEISLE